MDHKAKIAAASLTDTNIAAFIAQLGIDFEYSQPQLKKAMATLNFVNDRSGVLNTINKDAYPQLQLVKDVNKQIFFLFVCVKK